MNLKDDIMCFCRKLQAVKYEFYNCMKFPLISDRKYSKCDEFYKWIKFLQYLINKFPSVKLNQYL